ncbi:MAG: hypothetical protein MUO97_01810 [Dehalococcoidia bacterium]|nr:hypothetical protein [Dehalococcoidia bacterium]
MITKDELFKTGDKERIWQKYCGFLDLSLTEFMEIQEQLLMEQIDLVYDSPLATNSIYTIHSIYSIHSLIWMSFLESHTGSFLLPSWFVGSSYLVS